MKEMQTTGHKLASVSSISPLSTENAYFFAMQHEIVIVRATVLYRFPPVMSLAMFDVEEVKSCHLEEVVSCKVLVSGFIEKQKNNL